MKIRSHFVNSRYVGRPGIDYRKTLEAVFLEPFTVVGLQTNVMFPDFKHKAQEALWVIDRSNPQWGNTQVSALAPGTLQRSLSHWNKRLERSAKDKNDKETLEVYEQMQREGVSLDTRTFVSVLKACARLRELENGRKIHRHIIHVGCESNLYVGTSLVDMYAKCGSMEYAARVFDKMPTRDVVSWTALIKGYVKCGQGLKALELYGQMQLLKVNPVSATFVSVLDACASVEAIEEGRRVHAQIIQSGCESNVFVSRSLIGMYSQCGRIDDAVSVFNNLEVRNVFAWNAMLMGYVKCGRGWKTLELYEKMQAEGVEPISGTFLAVLNACASIGAIEEGKCVHAQIIESGFESNDFLCSSLIRMYSKWGSIEDANDVFKRMHAPNVMSWSAMMMGHARSGDGRKSLELYGQMTAKGLKPAAQTFVAVLNACANEMALEEGKCVHRQIIESGYQSDVFVGCSLIDMYSKCGKTEDGYQVFNMMHTRNVVAWSTMILAYVKCGEGWKALEFYGQMEAEGVEPSPGTFVAVLNACASVVALEEGKRVHAQIIQSDCECDVFVGVSLIDMYSKCGSIEDARGVFDRMSMQSVVTWNTMMLGYVKCGEALGALELFRRMQVEGVQPVAGTFVAVVNACASIGALEEGRCVHDQIVQTGCVSDIFVQCSLVDMYAKCGSIEEAREVFNIIHTKNVVPWNAMVLGYVKCGEGQKALELYQQMQTEGVDPDPVTFVGVLNACGSVAALGEGKHVHEQILQSGCESEAFVCSSLIDMYSKCGSIKDASEVFKKMRIRNLVSWNALIQGHVYCGDGKKALELYLQMQADGIEPDSYTFVAVLDACASLAALEEGRHVHAQICQQGYESNPFVSSSVINMFSKSGSIVDAERVFQKNSAKDIGCWNAMLGGYAIHGQAEDACQLFNRMHKEGVQIDKVTFISLLSACSHGGLVEKALHFFESMDPVYGVQVKPEHYACIVDVLGRAGRLDDAEDMINAMSCEPEASVWRSLLSACRVHGNLDMGERAAQKVIEKDPGNASAYVVLSNIYAAVGKWNSKEDFHQIKINRGLRKEGACSWIEVDKKMHLFNVDGQLHPEIGEIHAELRKLSQLMDAAGYASDTSSLLHDVEEERSSHLLVHSEMLAISFGLISTPSGTPICILKNLRICGDCHTVTKFISEISGRTILVRDAKHVHLFQNGRCNCKDYW